MPTEEELAAARAAEVAATVIVEPVVAPIVEPVVVPEVVLETPELVKERNMNALLDKESIGKGINSAGEVVEIKPLVSENVPTFAPSPLWNQLKEQISSAETPWEIPEHIVKGEFGEGKTEFQALLDHIYQNTDFSSVAPDTNDPFILEYNEARAKENFEINDWLKGRAKESSIMDLKGKDFMEAYYTKYKLKSDENPDGYTKEDIDIYIGTKNRIEIDRENEVLKKDITFRTADQNKENLKIIKDREIAQFTRQEETNQLAVSKFVKDNEFAKDFYGIEFSEAERAQFFKDLPGLFKRDPTTKLSTMDSLMQSESDILNLAAILWKGKEGLKSHVSGIKETIKANLEAKLGVNGKVESGTTVVPRSGPDHSKLV